MKKIINMNVYKINETSGFINEKLKYPIVNKIIFIKVIKKFVKKIDLVLSNNTWCK